LSLIRKKKQRKNNWLGSFTLPCLFNISTEVLKWQKRQHSKQRKDQAMINAKQKALINKGYSAIQGLNFLRWEQYREDLYKIEKDYEKGHRQFQYGRKHGMTIDQAAKYFAVKHILEALEKPDRYSVRDYLHLKKSAFMAQALVQEYGDKIKDMFSDFDIEAFKDLDYVRMIDA